MIKGVAILLMIFLHLFNNSSNVSECHNLIYIGGQPLVLLLSKASNPVAFFLILGGYGLYKVYEKGDHNRWSRLLKLYLHYWVILLVFVSIGHFIRPEVYPGSFLYVISNIIGYHTNYNGEMWFLLPYVILSALSPMLFRMVKKVKALYIIVFTLLIHIATSYCISRYGESFLYLNYWAYNPLLVLYLLFNFSLGAMAARTDFFERLRSKRLNHIGLYAWGGVIALVSFNCIFKYNFFYAFGIITCLLFIPLPTEIKNSLCKLGDQSMNMWMIHSWFCYYLFHNFIYSFSYPLLIFIVLVIISYVSSLLINLIAVPIERIFLTKKEITSKPIL